jgi:hypothetical protein
VTLGTLVIVVLVGLVVLLVGAWYAATRVKQRIDAEAPAAARARRALKVTPACVVRLRALSDEPLLLKLDDGVLRYQVGNRPMAPAAVAPGESATALREVGSALVTEFGAHWVAVVQPSAEDSVAVDRLA